LDPNHDGQVTLPELIASAPSIAAKYHLSPPPASALQANFAAIAGTASSFSLRMYRKWVLVQIKANNTGVENNIATVTFMDISNFKPTVNQSGFVNYFVNICKLPKCRPPHHFDQKLSKVFGKFSVNGLMDYAHFISMLEAAAAH